MKKHGWNIIWVTLVGWALCLLIFAVPGNFEFGRVLIAVVTILMFITAILTIISLYILLSGLSMREPKNDNFASGLPAQIVASLIIVFLITSFFMAMRSLWFSPFGDDYPDRFKYENVAVALSFGAIVLTIILSALQKDIYWVTRMKTVKLDERLLKERQTVFERSYKYTAVMLLLIWWIVGSRLYNIPAIMANHAGTLPGHIWWMGIDIIVAVFAMPLLIAAMRSKK